jgi:hypothetical protein
MEREREREGGGRVPHNEEFIRATKPREMGCMEHFIRHEGNDESFHHFFFRFIDSTVWLIQLQNLLLKI